MNALSIIVRTIFLCIGCIFFGLSCTSDREKQGKAYDIIDSYLAKANNKEKSNTNVHKIDINESNNNLIYI